MGFFRTKLFVAIVSFLAGMAFMLYLVKRTYFHLVTGPMSPPVFMDPMEESLRNMRRLQEEMMKGMGGFGEDPMFQGGFSYGGLELKNEGDHYTLEVDLRGMRPDNFNVQVANGQLTVEGTLKGSEDDSSFSSRFQRSIPVPEDVDPGGIQMETKGDHVIVTLPKRR